jgi:hypothetical protein
VTDDWKPITEAELQLRLMEEERLLSTVELQRYETWKVSLGTRGTVANFNTDGVELVHIVARRGRRVVFFDDAEDEFAGGDIDDEAIISAPRLYGDLRNALHSLG